MDLNNFIISTEYDGKRRRLYPKNCQTCDKCFYIPKPQYDKRRFCSKLCLQNRTDAKGIKVSCARCGKITHKTPSKLAGSRSGIYFCSRFCKDKARNLLIQDPIKGKCRNCDKLGATANSIYCSIVCRLSYGYNTYINNWLIGNENGNYGIGRGLSVHNYVRRYMLSLADDRCSKCGWGKINPTNGRMPLAVHHIDGDANNSILRNLEVLCPNCHSLTPNYGSLNYGRSARTLKHE